MAGRDVPMSLRRLIVEVDVTQVNVVQFCKDHGVSTWLFYDLRRRHRRGESIEAKSTAPKRVANRTAAAIEDAIVAKRKQLEAAGLDAGPATLRWQLMDAGVVGVPSEATIYRILKARGCVIAEPRKKPKRTCQRFVARYANELWQLDDTPWTLADGSAVKILDVLDDHSRLAVASTALETVTGVAALEVVSTAAGVLGWPAGFLSDNATAFRHVLAAALGELGIDATHSRPYHPQTNGKVERFHQTLKRYLAQQPPAATIDELQAQLDLFRLFYNHHRRHRGIDRQRPADVWNTATKIGPAHRPIGPPSHLYTSIVHSGCVRLGSKWRITIGAQFNGARALAVVTGTACHVFVDGCLARALTLDPNRKDQPLYTRAGRPLP
jgi:transposase InsO family protein